MDQDASWFSDDQVLVRELRRSQRVYQPPRLPGYEGLKELRRGGQGVVFVGKQISTRRLVAIKLVLEGALASREARRRFEREIDLVATLRHPNIVRVYDSGESDDGRLYYVMEFIEGVGLDEVMRSGMPEPRGGGDSKSPETAATGHTHLVHSQREMLTMFAKICDGVQHAHQKGVIHRDLKPSNVRIDREGEPHVLDFGLAKLAGTGVDVTQMSVTGSFMGSLPWASPEQTEGSSRQLDVRSDVYSLGVMLYQLLTGQFPYRVDGSLREVLQFIQTSSPRPLREIRPGISDEIATITMKCLAKEPDRRYQSAGDLARDIRRYLADEPIEAKRDSAWYSVRKTLDRYKTMVRAVSVLLVASLIFSAAMVWLRTRAVKAEQLAAQRLKDLEIAHQSEVDARKALEVQVSKNTQVRDFLDTTLRAVDPWKHPGRELGPLRELLDSAVRRLDGAFPDQPDVEAAIAGTLGYDYWELGLHKPAEKLLRRSYELFKKTQGEAHLDTMNALNNLARLMTEQGRHAEAVELFTQLRDVQERTLGPEHPGTLVTNNNLALDLDWQGHSSEAEAIYRRTLEAQTRLFGKLNSDRLSTLNNLASCLPALGKMEEAERLFTEVIEDRTSASAADHPETLQARLNLANFYNQAGRLAEAEDRLRALVEQVESSLGAKHPVTISALHNLAEVVSNRGRLEEGLAISRRAYEAQLAFAGPNHPTTLTRKSQIATTLIQLRRWDEAIPLATEVRNQYAETFGGDDWRTLTFAGNLAYALNQFGQHEAAEAIWNQIIADANPHHEATAVAAASARANLGSLFADQGRWGIAESALREAIEMQDGIGECDHFRTAIMRTNLGRVLSATGRLGESEWELGQAYACLSEALGDEHEKTQRAISELVRLYQKKGNSNSEEAFRAKLKLDGALVGSASD